jgi:hypothetical protein
MGLCALELFLGLDFGHEHWRIVIACFMLGLVFKCLCSQHPGATRCIVESQVGEARGTKLSNATVDYVWPLSSTTDTNTTYTRRTPSTLLYVSVSASLEFVDGCERDAIETRRLKTRSDLTI